MARQDNLLVTAFHPEITDDLRVHKYFLDIVDARQKSLIGCSASGVERVSV
jgi:5'-phosphate synthase pdxT subunit